jgi:hypothetical protein
MISLLFFVFLFSVLLAGFALCIPIFISEYGLGAFARARPANADRLDLVIVCRSHG